MLYNDLSSAQAACESHGFGCAGVTKASPASCAAYEWYSTAQNAPSGTDCTAMNCIYDAMWGELTGLYVSEGPQFNGGANDYIGMTTGAER